MENCLGFRVPHGTEIACSILADIKERPPFSKATSMGPNTLCPVRTAGILAQNGNNDKHDEKLNTDKDDK